MLSVFVVPEPDLGRPRLLFSVFMVLVYIENISNQGKNLDSIFIRYTIN